MIMVGSCELQQINETDETTLLATMAMPLAEQEKQLCSNGGHMIHSLNNVEHVTPSKTVDVVKVHISDDDDDDDLIPFDIRPQTPPNAHHYLREAISGTILCVIMSV